MATYDHTYSSPSPQHPYEVPVGTEEDVDKGLPNGKLMVDWAESDECKGSFTIFVRREPRVGVFAFSDEKSAILFKLTWC